MARPRSLKRRIRSLSEREAEGRRDLGVLVLEMFRRDELDTDALGSRAAEVAGVSEEIDALRLELGEDAAEPELAAAQPEASTAEPEPVAAPGDPEPAAATLPAGDSPEAATAGAEASAEDKVRAQLGYSGAGAPSEPEPP